MDLDLNHVEAKFFGCSLMETWTINVREERRQSLRIPQNTCFLISNRDLRKESTFFSIFLTMYFLLHVFVAIWQTLRGGSDRFQSNQKQEKICLYFLASAGD